MGAHALFHSGTLSTLAMSMHEPMACAGSPTKDQTVRASHLDNALVTLQEQLPSFRYYLPKMVDHQHGANSKQLFHHAMSGITSCGWHVSCPKVVICQRNGPMYFSDWQCVLWPNDNNVTKWMIETDINGRNLCMVIATAIHLESFQSKQIQVENRIKKWKDVEGYFCGI